MDVQHTYRTDDRRALYFRDVAVEQALRVHVVARFPLIPQPIAAVPRTTGASTARTIDATPRETNLTPATLAIHSIQ
jgi:hypothetical protein